MTSLCKCVEPFEIDTEVFENYLVVKATITNELKNQEIYLSRTYPLEENGPVQEQGAEIEIIASNGTLYSFIENTPGKYTSNQAFAVLPNISYSLNIKTNDDKTYQSINVETPQEITIEDLYLKRMFNDSGEDGLGIFVDNFNSSSSPLYFRYEYEETYKIAPPFWAGRDVTSVSLDPLTSEVTVQYADRPQEEKICYNTRISNEILLNTTNSLSDNNRVNFLTKFIEVTDISVAERYTILVKQYVQSREAYKFYETLNSFSESTSLFSQIQTGFVNGNIVSTTNKDEKVIGFFDVSTVNEKRIFFNKKDLLSDIIDGYYECNFFIPVLELSETIEDYVARLNEDIKRLKFKETVIPASPGTGFFMLVSRTCGDCTVLGQSEKPDFWID